jgi:hypothetical protein
MDHVDVRATNQSNELLQNLKGTEAAFIENGNAYSFAPKSTGEFSIIQKGNLYSDASCAGEFSHQVEDLYLRTGPKVAGSQMKH